MTSVCDITSVLLLIAVSVSAFSQQPKPELTNQARLRLARHLKIADNGLTLQTSRAEQFSDSALGCPSPGASYLGVIVPGFVLVFAAGGQRYDVHADENGRTFVLCTEGRPTTLEASPASPSTRNAPMSAQQQAIVTRARESLARELGTNAGDIDVIEAAEGEWRDSALGCPKPGVRYLRVITPGYRIVLEWMGKRYEYHSDQQANIVRCD